MKRLYSLLIVAALTTSASMLVASDSEKEKGKGGTTAEESLVDDGASHKDTVPATLLTAVHRTPGRTAHLQDGAAPIKSRKTAEDGTGSDHSSPHVSPRKLDLGGGPKFAAVLHRLISDAVARRFDGCVGLMPEDKLNAAFDALSMEPNRRAGRKSRGKGAEDEDIVGVNADEEGEVEEDTLLGDVDEALAEFIGKVVGDTLSSWHRGGVADLHIEELQEIIARALADAPRVTAILNGGGRELSVPPTDGGSAVVTEQKVTVMTAAELKAAMLAAMTSPEFKTAVAGALGEALAVKSKKKEEAPDGLVVPGYRFVRGGIWMAKAPFKMMMAFQQALVACALVIIYWEYFASQGVRVIPR